MEREKHPKSPDSDPLFEAALTQAQLMAAEYSQKPVSEVTSEDIIHAYQNGGFATWPPEVAAQLAKLPEFEHI